MQVVNRIEREDFSNGNREFWALSDGKTVPPARATHYVGGLTYEKQALLIDAELFYKSTVFNVYDRQNVWYKQFQGFSSQLVETDVHLMGRAFNLSVGLRF